MLFSEEQRENLVAIAEMTLGQDITFEVIDYSPGDFGGSGSSRGEYTILVNNGYAIKEQLKRLGFRWDKDRKQWAMKHVRTSSQFISPKFSKFLKGQPSAEKVKATIPKVQALIKKTNAATQLVNKSKLAKGGLPQDTPHHGIKELAKMVDHVQRAQKALVKHGIKFEYKGSGSIGGFFKSGTGRVRYSGKTFGVKDVFKQAGFKYADKGWEMDQSTYGGISKNFNQKLLKHLSQGGPAKGADMY